MLRSPLRFRAPEDPDLDTPSPHTFWQTLGPPGRFAAEPPEGHRIGWPARLADGRLLLLPIRVLPGERKRAVASLIVNQASFAVEDALAEAMTVRALDDRAEVVVGVPTLGLPLAAGVARRLGHPRMIALGTSRKFWYDEALSVPMASITSPEHVRRLYLDPRMLPLLEGRRVLVVDDVISSGRSMTAVLSLLALAGVRPVAIAVAMAQTRRWEAALRAIDETLPARVRSAFETPMLALGEDGGWRTAPDAEAWSVSPSDGIV